MIWQRRASDSSARCRLGCNPCDRGEGVAQSATRLQIGTGQGLRQTWSSRLAQMHSASSISSHSSRIENLRAARKRDMGRETGWPGSPRPGCARYASSLSKDEWGFRQFEPRQGRRETFADVLRRRVLHTRTSPFSRKIPSTFLVLHHSASATLAGS